MIREFPSIPSSMANDYNELAFVRRHQTYYLEDGNIIFLVERHLFCIHRYFLRGSPVFREMLAPDSHIARNSEGDSDDNPIILEGVTSLDFERLLWVFYKNPFHPLNASARHWKSVVTLARLWQFDTIASEVADLLWKAPMKPIEKIGMAIDPKLGLSREWAKEAFVELCSRPRALSVRDCKVLGPELTAPICRIREELKTATNPRDLCRKLVDRRIITDEEGEEDTSDEAIMRTPILRKKKRLLSISEPRAPSRSGTPVQRCTTPLEGSNNPTQPPSPIQRFSTPIQRLSTPIQRPTTPLQRSSTPSPVIAAPIPIRAPTPKRSMTPRSYSVPSITNFVSAMF